MIDPDDLSGSLLVEARAVLCPVPIIRLAAAARGAPAGTLITLLSDDPAAGHDVPAWCRLRGHELVAEEVAPASSERLAELLLRLARTPTMLPEAESAPEPSLPAPFGDQVLIHLIRVSG